MKIDKKYKIQKSCSTDETRFSIQNPYLERDGKGKGILIATDGRMLAKVPVDLDKTDRKGYVPLGALVELQSDKTGQTTLNVNGSAEIVRPDGTKITFKRDKEYNFPNWRQLKPNGEIKAEITFSPARLLDLARALGVANGEPVTLKIRGELDPIEVEGIGEADGLLMPMQK